MAITLPLPVRVAAGLVATGIALVRSLPEEIPAIPVALVGNAMRLSMKVQQEITTLAVRGDELLGPLVGGRPEESPGWATFDEDTQPASTRAARPYPHAAPAKSATAKPTGTRPARAKPDEARPADAAPAKPTEPPTEVGATEPPAAAPAEVTEAKAPEPPPDPTKPAETSAPTAQAPADEQDLSVETVRHTPDTTALPDSDTTATGAAAEVSDEVLEAVLETPTPTAPADASSADVGTADADGEPTAPPDTPSTDASTADEPVVAGEPVDAGGEPAGADDGPAALPGYDRMTLAQVRGHLRELTADDVSTLLGYEQSGDNRAPFLTLLSNRLVTLGAQES
ncbi:MAG TPA: lipid droplet-associated protein [Nakamurella sp.]